MAVSYSVVEKLAARRGVDPLDLPPMFEAIDPDGLDRLVGSLSADSEITFTYAGHSVTVTGNEEIAIEPAADSG